MRTFNKKMTYKFVAPVASSVVLYEPPVMSELYHESIDFGDHVCTHYGNDVTLLFNQRRIDKLSTNPTEAINAWLSRLAPSSSDALGDLRRKCTDEQLLSIVKSRHIQSPSELQAWSAWLSANIDEALASAKTETDKTAADESTSNTAAHES